MLLDVAMPEEQYRRRLPRPDEAHGLIWPLFAPVAELGKLNVLEQTPPAIRCGRMQTWGPLFVPSSIPQGCLKDPPAAPRLAPTGRFAYYAQPEGKSTGCRCLIRSSFSGRSNTRSMSWTRNLSRGSPQENRVKLLLVACTRRTASDSLLKGPGFLLDVVPVAMASKTLDDGVKIFMESRVMQNIETVIRLVAGEGPLLLDGDFLRVRFAFHALTPKAGPSTTRMRH